MTEYRIVSNGYYSYLQYLYKYRVLPYWYRSVWKYIWKPQNDYKYPMVMSDPDSRCHICSLSCNLKEFAKKWPNIKKYFEWAEKRQKELDEKMEMEKMNREKRISQIIYL